MLAWVEVTDCQEIDPDLLSGVRRIPTSDWGKFECGLIKVLR